MASSGTITRMMRERGFGFIRDEHGRQYFFHHTAVEDGRFETLHVGDRVTFDPAGDPHGKGAHAINVARAQADN